MSFFIDSNSFKEGAAFNTACDKAAQWIDDIEKKLVAFLSSKLSKVS